MNAPIITFFIHGLESSNKGTKATYFSNIYPDMQIPNFSGSLDNRLLDLFNLTSNLRNVVLIGSSFGGLMAAVHALVKPEAISKLILLAPALNFPEFHKYAHFSSDIETIIYQGIHDTVTPLAKVKPAAEKCFQNLTFHACNDDHILRKSFISIDWNNILST